LWRAAKLHIVELWLLNWLLELLLTLELHLREAAWVLHLVHLRLHLGSELLEGLLLLPTHHVTLEPAVEVGLERVNAAGLHHLLLDCAVLLELRLGHLRCATVRVRLKSSLLRFFCYGVRRGLSRLRLRLDRASVAHNLAKKISRLILGSCLNRLASEIEILGLSICVLRFGLRVKVEVQQVANHCSRLCMRGVLFLFLGSEVKVEVFTSLVFIEIEIVEVVASDLVGRKFLKARSEVYIVFLSCYS